ncbi:MAG: hypothetical protein BWY75_02937 [bacterium ADurb.Bin425]|nr:MAG: hypothetical protein BWY75_02937 [bacterium ADurb.Bin425]
MHIDASFVVGYIGAGIAAVVGVLSGLQTFQFLKGAYATTGNAIEIAFG